MAALAWLRACAGLRLRFHVGHQRVELLFTDQSLEGRHDGLESFDDFRAGIEDGFAKVVLVGGDHASIFELHGLAKHSLQVGAASLRVGAMTGGAAEFGEDLFAAGGEWAAGAAAHPGLVLRGLHDDDGTDHAGVLGAAVFGAEQVIGARLGGAEPGDGVAAGEHVLLHAERGNEEAVDDVLRSHDEFDVAADGDVQFVDLALAFGVFELPHPLLGDDVDFGRIARRRAALEVDDRAPGEDHHEDAERNDRPGEFEGSGAFDLFGQNAFAMAIARGEIDDGDEDQKGHQPGHDEQEDEESIDVARHAGGPLRPQWKVIEHIAFN